MHGNVMLINYTTGREELRSYIFYGGT